MRGRHLGDCLRRPAKDPISQDPPERERILSAAKARSADCPTPSKHSPRNSPSRTPTRPVIAKTPSTSNGIESPSNGIEDNSGIGKAILAPVSSSFCVPHASHFEVKNKSFYISSITYVTDEEGSQILFKMKTGGGILPHTKRSFYDATSGEVLLVMKRKVHWFGTNSWVAFDGPGSDSESHVLFTLKRKRFSCGSSRVSLEGFLPAEHTDHSSNHPDFSMEATSWRSDYSVRLANGTPIAEGKLVNGVACSIDVYPDVDRAFVAALSMIWISEYFSDNGCQGGP